MQYMTYKDVFVKIMLVHPAYCYVYIPSFKMDLKKYPK